MEGAHDPRHLPRRPARRQPVRAARRPHRAARLRHHRPADRADAGWPSCGCMLGATTNDVKGQLAALRDLGALPRRHRPRRGHRATSASTSRRSTRPRSPATSWSTEIQRVVKALLGYGARMPKELMLFVKNMVFLDGAIATLAPDLDMLAEIANISMLLRRDPRRAHRPASSASTQTAARSTSTA